MRCGKRERRPHTASRRRAGIDFGKYRVGLGRI